MKRLYETVWEIFNKCSNNQMRDVFIDEIELEEENLETFIRTKIRDRNMTLERTDLENGTVIYDIMASDIKQRYSFTPIE